MRVSDSRYVLTQLPILVLNQSTICPFYLLLVSPPLPDQRLPPNSFFHQLSLPATPNQLPVHPISNSLRHAPTDSFICLVGIWKLLRRGWLVDSREGRCLGRWDYVRDRLVSSSRHCFFLTDVSFSCSSDDMKERRFLFVEYSYTCKALQEIWNINATRKTQEKSLVFGMVGT